MLARALTRRHTKAALMRVYLPLTLPALAAAYGAGELAPAPLDAYAVTPALRAWLGEDAGGAATGKADANSRTSAGKQGKNPSKGAEAAREEELEYEALTAAARASVGLLAEDASAPPFRVVVAAEVPDSAVEPVEAGPEADPAETAGLVELRGTVPLTKIAAVHADAEEATDAVAAAATAWRAADGRGDASFPPALEDVEDHELLWYATQEIPDLLS